MRFGFASAMRAGCFALVTTLGLGTSSHAQVFTRILTGPHVTNGGASRAVCWADVDRDGDLDLFVTNGPSTGQANALFRNEGAPGYEFTKVVGDPIVTGLFRSDGASFADFDNDGDLDAFIVNWYGDDNLLYLGNGDGTFVRELSGPAVTDGGHSETCAWGDYDRDGWADLHVTNSGDTAPEADFLYHNDQDGTLSRVLGGPIASDLFYTRSCSWIDVDRDGDDDLFVTNENGEAEILYQNQLVPSGTATFAAVTPNDLPGAGAASFSAAWADYDNDGDFDCFVANSSTENNSLLRNDAGTFTRMSADITSSDDGWSVCGIWGDMDNDGDLDLFVTNAFGGTTTKRNFLYRNRLIETGTASFEKITTGPVTTNLGWSYGAAWGDYDQDGDLDLYVARTFNNNESETLYQNGGVSGTHWLELDLEGTVSNRSALGAIVRAKATIGGQPVEMLRVVEGQAAYCSQNLRLHFGLGDAAVVDTLEVIWPSGLREITIALPADQRKHLVEGSIPTGVGEPRGDGTSVSLVAWHRSSPNPSTRETTVEFALRRAGRARLEVLDTTGRRLTVLLDRFVEAGPHRAPWRLPAGVSSGVYLYRLTVEGVSQTGKLTVLR